jgi:hypothetical protein
MWKTVVNALKSVFKRSEVQQPEQYETTTGSTNETPRNESCASTVKVVIRTGTSVEEVTVKSEPGSTQVVVTLADRHRDSDPGQDRARECEDELKQKRAYDERMERKATIRTVMSTFGCIVGSAALTASLTVATGSRLPDFLPW